MMNTHTSAVTLPARILGKPRRAPLEEASTPTGADTDQAWVDALRSRLTPACMLAHLSCLSIRAPALWLVGYDPGSALPSWRCETTLDGLSFSHAGGSADKGPKRVTQPRHASRHAHAALTQRLGDPLLLGSYPGAHWSQTRFFDAIPDSALRLWALDPDEHWEQIALGSGLDGAPHARLLAAALDAEEGVAEGSPSGRPVRI